MFVEYHGSKKLPSIETSIKAYLSSCCISPACSFGDFCVFIAHFMEVTVNNTPVSAPGSVECLVQACSTALIGWLWKWGFGDLIKGQVFFLMGFRNIKDLKWKGLTTWAKWTITAVAFGACTLLITAQEGCGVPVMDGSLGPLLKHLSCTGGTKGLVVGSYPCLYSPGPRTE